ncbi:BON1-associated protein 2, partial [Mucuna pruriens]
MEASTRTLEITVISVENLRVTEDAYVVVRAESLNCCTTKTVTKDDGTNFLSWNENFLLDVPVHARSITFEVQCNRFKGSRPLGVARIVATDFIGASVPENQLRMLSYGLRDWEGKRNGIIHFAVKVAPPPEERLKKTVARKGCGDRFAGRTPSEVVLLSDGPSWTEIEIT